MKVYLSFLFLAFCKGLHLQSILHSVICKHFILTKFSKNLISRKFLVSRFPISVNLIFYNYFFCYTLIPGKLNQAKFLRKADCKSMFLQKKKKVFPFESQEFCKHCDLKLSPQESSPLEIFSDLISDLNQWSRIEDLFTFYFQLKKSEKVATFP